MSSALVAGRGSVVATTITIVEQLVDDLLHHLGTHASIQNAHGIVNSNQTMRSCVVTLAQIANSALSKQGQSCYCISGMEFGEEVVVNGKKMYRGVDSLLTLQHAVFTGIKAYTYIDLLSQKLCKQVAKAEVEDTAIIFAPCRDTFSNEKRKVQMLEGDSRGKTMALKNEYWGTLRPLSFNTKMRAAPMRRTPLVTFCSKQ